MPPKWPIDLLVTTARLHYVEGRSQGEVATHLNLSRATVSRLLAASRRQGIVEFWVESGRPGPRTT